MKKFFLFLCVCFGGIAGGAPYSIGDAVGNLDECVWVKQNPVAIAGERARPHVLFFWTISYAGNQDIDRMLALRKKFGNDVGFIAVGCDDEAKIKSFFRLKEMDFPVVSDTVLKNLHAYLRQPDSVPFCAIIDHAGRLAWRGPVSQLGVPLEKIVARRFDLDYAIRFDRYTQDVSGAMQQKDYARALELTEKELTYDPENIELVILAAGLLEQHLHQPELAQKKIEDALAAYPKNPSFHEIYIRFLHNRHLHDKILHAVDSAIRSIPGDLDFIRRLIHIEMSQRPGEISPEALLHLGKAAVDIPSYKNDREHALAQLLYARILAFCAMPERALQVAREARPLLTDPKDISRTDDVIRHYQEILRVSRTPDL